MILRPYQTEALNNIKTAWDQGIKRQLVVAATGVGKGLILANIKNWLGLKGRVFIFVHREEIIRQLEKHLKKWNPEASIGIEMADESCSDHEDVVIASVQSIGRRASTRLNKFDPKDFCLLITDEAHKAAAETYRNVYDYFKVDRLSNSHILHAGFTATPNRGDGQGLGTIYDKITYEYPIHRAIAEGWLVDLKPYAVRTRTSLDSVEYRAGDFAVDDLAVAVNTDTRNIVVVNGWKQYGEDRQTICFATNVAHAQALAKTFKSAGIKAEAIWGSDPDRGSKLDNYKNKKTKVLVNINIFTEGFDNPDTSCILMARPTSSNLLFTQAIGRGLRLQDGTGNLVEAKLTGNLPEKLNCVILDITDNCEKHKLVSTASLFGLPINFNLKGTPPAEAEKTFKQLQSDHPTVNFDRLTSFEEINTYLHKVSLFDISLPKEIEKISKMRWLKQGQNFIMPLSFGQSTNITKDLLDNHTLKIKLKNQTPITETFKKLDDALFYAESYLKQNLPYLQLMFVSKNSKLTKKFHNEPATTKQKNLIRKLGENAPEIDSLDKATAMYIIQKLLAEKPHASNRRKNTNTAIYQQ